MFTIRSVVQRVLSYQHTYERCLFTRCQHGLQMRFASYATDLKVEKYSPIHQFLKKQSTTSEFRKTVSSDASSSNFNTNENDTSSSASSQDGPDRLDIRVGKVLEVSRHPDADTLYVLKVDLAEVQPRTIISGLVKFVTQEELDKRLVAVLCNLKPSKMRGIVSEGMLLCTSNADLTAVEPIIVPATTTPGSRLLFEGYNGTPDEQLKPKKKVWEKLSVDFKTNSDGAAMWKDRFLMTSTGEKLTSKLTNCSVK